MNNKIKQPHNNNTPAMFNQTMRNMVDCKNQLPYIFNVMIRVRVDYGL
jgi:hypothetical protein